MSLLDSCDARLWHMLIANFDRRLRQGVAKLWWGSNMLDTALETGLMFASDRALIEPDCADADLFPAGAVFISKRGETIGSVQSLKCAADHAITRCPLTAAHVLYLDPALG